MVEPKDYIWLLETAYDKWGGHFRTTKVGVITHIYTKENGDLNIITSGQMSLGNDTWTKDHMTSFSKTPDGRIVKCGHICSPLKTSFYNTNPLFSDKPFIKALNDFFVVSPVPANSNYTQDVVELRGN